MEDLRVFLIHLVVHYGIHKNCHTVLCQDLLRGDLVRLGSHIDLLVNIYAGDDEEDSRPPGSSSHQPAQSEDDGSLVLLDHLDSEEEGEGEGAEDDEDAGDGEKEGAETRTLLAGGYKQRLLD